MPTALRASDRAYQAAHVTLTRQARIAAATSTGVGEPFIPTGGHRI